MKFGLWTANGALNSKPVFTAFAKGIEKLDYQYVINKPSDIEVIWSVLWNGRMQRNKIIWDRCQKEKKPIIVLEVGCLYRGTTWKIGVNGVNRRAYFGPKGNDSKRATELKLYAKDRNLQDGNILYAGQHQKSGQWMNENHATSHLHTSISEIRKYTAKKIIIRPHPRSKLKINLNQYANVELQNPNKIIGTYDDFDMHFTNVSAVINWSSNPGVTASLAGIPVFVGPDSLAYNVSNTAWKNICNPIVFDRTQWLNDLAYTEWTIPEIETGFPLKRLTSGLI